jgi:hypothetical protein
LILAASTVSFGAKFEEVDKSADKKIRSLEKYFDKTVFPALLEGDQGLETGGFVTHFKITSKKSAEKWVNSIKQLIYIERSKWGAYSRPDEVEAKTIVKNKRGYLKAAQAFDIHQLLLETILKKRGELATELRKQFGKRGYTVIKGFDGNSFGSCTWLAILR